MQAQRLREVEMRIAYLCQSYPPVISGPSVAARRLAEGMAGRGHEVMVITASDQPHPYTTTTSKLKVVRLRSLPNPVRAEQRYPVRPRKRLLATLQAFAPHVVHDHSLLNIGLAGLSYTRATNTPAVLTIHALPWFVSSCVPDLPGLRWTIEEGLWAYARWLHRQYRVSIAPSNAVANVASAYSDRRPYVISNGTDLGRFTPHQAIPEESRVLREKYGLHPDLPVIIHVGRIDVEKHVDLAIRAAAGAVQSVDAQLLVVGDGRRRAAMVQLSDRLSLRGRSCFPGFVPPEGDLAGLYRLASVFVTGSEVETQGLVLLEAAASGLPVVAFRATAIPEVVKDGRTGYLVLPRDVPAMTDRIVTLLRNPEQARAMGQAGRALALDHSLERTMDRHERLYQTLVSEAVAVEHGLVRRSQDGAQVY